MDHCLADEPQPKQRQLLNLPIKLACSAHYRRYLLHIIHAATHYQRSLRSFVVFPRANGRAASATPTKFAAVGSSASSELSTANLYGVLARRLYRYRGGCAPPLLASGWPECILLETRLSPDASVSTPTSRQCAAREFTSKRATVGTAS